MAKHIPLHAYVTFRALPAKEAVLRAYDITPMMRLIKKAECKGLYLLGEGFPAVTAAVDPTIITWENVGQAVAMKAMRYAAAALLSACFLVASFFGIRALYNSDNQDSNSNWNNNWAISFFVAVMNWILQLVLNYIGVRRYTKNVADNHIYRTLTIAFSQIINVIVVYGLAYNSFVAASNDLPDDFGTYGKFNMRWYLAVGTPLVMTVTLSLFVPHIDLIFASLFKAFIRCRDRGCSCNKRSTKLLT